MDKLPLAIIVAVGLLVPALFFTGPIIGHGQDDATYLQNATQFLQGSYNMDSYPLTYGIGNIAMAAAGLSLGFPSLLYWLGFILLSVTCYLLCRRYFEERVSLLAVLSMQLSYFVFSSATRVLPDIWSGLLVGLAFLSLSYAKREEGYRLPALLLSGVAIGSLIFIKIGSFSLVLIFFVSCLLFGVEKRKFLLALVTGLLAPIGLYECLAAFYGTNIITMIDKYTIFQTSLSGATPLGNLVLSPFMFVFGYFPNKVWNFNIYSLGLFALVAAIGIFYAMKSRKVRVYALFFLLGAGYLLAGSESLTHYQSISVESRYFIWFVPCMCVCFCAFMERFGIKEARHYAIILGLVFLTSLPMVVWYFPKG